MKQQDRDYLVIITALMALFLLGMLSTQCRPTHVSVEQVGQ